MVRIVYGYNRGAKTLSVYKQAVSAADRGRPVMLIVPEQTVLQTEDALCALGSVSLETEVVSFRRLCNCIFRKYGGLCYNYITKGGKLTVMWKVIKELEGQLAAYSDISPSDASMLKMLLSAVNEFEECGVTPDMLSVAADKIGETDAPFSSSLAELAEIYSLYLFDLHEKYDDSSDDIAQAVKLLTENGGKCAGEFFGGRSVFIDGFSGFTAGELKMLRCIFKGSDDVTLTLGYEKGDRREMFERLVRTDHAVRHQAGLANVTVLDGACREPFALPGLGTVAEGIWGFGEPQNAKVRGGEAVRLVKCKDRFAEAQFIALDIKKKVLAGERFNAFTVVLRNPSDYRGVLEPAFERYGIPLFFSLRSDVRTKPQARLIISALSLKLYNWRCEDVVSYIRSGLCGITDDMADAFIEYITMWTINGAGRYLSGDWLMNPAGFGEERTEKTEALLSELNRLKGLITEPLSEFFEAFGKDATVEDACRALVRFLVRLDVRGQITENAKRQRSEGKNASADESMQLWNTVTDILDTLVCVAGNVRIGAEEFSKLLSAVFEASDIGKIPSASDEVRVVPAELFREANRKYVYIPGVNEGSFPAAFSEVRLIGDKRREILAELGVELTPPSDSAASDELLHFYNAVTSAMHGVTVSFNGASRPSGAVYALRKVLRDIGADDSVFDFSSVPDIGKIASPETAFEYVASHKKSVKAQAILSILKSRNNDNGQNKHGFAFTLAEKALDIPLSEEKCTVDSEGKEHGELYLSQSKLEAYVNCPFLYFCRYVIGIKPTGTGDVESNDIGNYVHKVLELFFRRAAELDLMNNESKEAEALTEQVVNEVIGEYTKKLFENSPGERARRLSERLSGLSRLMIRNILQEFRQSEFRPLLFELPIDRAGGIPSLPMLLDDGTRIRLGGYIDRVDTYTSGNDVFVRVVDYKTGTKTFSIANIERGLNLQMLIYLFTLCAAGGNTEGNLLKIPENGRALPAGVLYFLAGMPSVLSKTGEPESNEAALREVMRHIKRTGLLTDNQEVLRAMEKELAGLYIPVKANRDGSVSASSSVAGEDVFENLKRTVFSEVEKIAIGIKSGRADALPLTDAAHDACKYCDMRMICRRKDKDNGEVCANENRDGNDDEAMKEAGRENGG